MTASKKNIGLFLLIAPLPGLMATLSLYAISSFVFTSMAVSSGSQGMLMVGQIVNVVLGLLGTICVLGIILGMPLGLAILLTVKPEQAASQQAPAAVEGETPERAQDVEKQP